MANSTKNTNKTIFKIVVSALTVLMLLLIIALIVNLVRLGAANSRKQALAEQNARISQIIDNNESLIDYCESAEFIEEYAREVLDMVYRGETVIGGQ